MALKVRRASGISLETLKALSERPGVSGYEAPVRDLLRGLIEPYVDSVAVDTMGNLIAVIDTVREGPYDDIECDESVDCSEDANEGEIRRSVMARVSEKGSHRPVRVLLAAHMDEVGILITHIERDGTLRFGCVGGIDASVLPAKRVLIGENGVPGVILWKPIHLEKKNAEIKPPSVDSLFIDIGATDLDDAKKMVALGDFGVFATDFEQFGDGRAKGKAFDDRVGCLILAELVKRRSIWAGGDKTGSASATRDRGITVGFAFTVQEEVGL
ncbi:MAG TPA: M42 family metallopeptidase, partial [Clostridia bacterium]|nr:M42 family metallopeptidase [Clostridia bacterium]